MFIFFFCSCYKVKLLCSSSVFFFTSLSFICLLLSSFFLSVCISSFISLLLSTFAHLPYYLLFIFLLFFFFFSVPPLLMMLLLPLSVVVDVIGLLFRWPLCRLSSVCLRCLYRPLSIFVARPLVVWQPSPSVSVRPFTAICLTNDLSIRPLVCIVCLPAVVQLPLWLQLLSSPLWPRRFKTVFPAVSVRFIPNVSDPVQSFLFLHVFVRPPFIRPPRFRICLCPATSAAIWPLWPFLCISSALWMFVCCLPAVRPVRLPSHLSGCSSHLSGYVYHLLLCTDRLSDSQFVHCPAFGPFWMLFRPSGSVVTIVVHHRCSGRPTLWPSIYLCSAGHLLVSSVLSGPSLVYPVMSFQSCSFFLLS